MSVLVFYQDKVFEVEPEQLREVVLGDDDFLRYACGFASAVNAATYALLKKRMKPKEEPKAEPPPASVVGTPAESTKGDEITPDLTEVAVKAGARDSEQPTVNEIDVPVFASVETVLFRIDEFVCEKCESDKLTVECPKGYEVPFTAKYTCGNCKDEGAMRIDAETWEILQSQGKVVKPKAKKKTDTKKTDTKKTGTKKTGNAKKKSKKNDDKEDGENKPDAPASAGTEKGEAPASLPPLDELISKRPELSVTASVCAEQMLKVVTRWEMTKLIQRWEQVTKLTYQEGKFDVEQMRRTVANALAGIQ